MDRPATEVEVSQPDLEPKRQYLNIFKLAEVHLKNLHYIENRRLELIELMQSDWRKFAAEKQE